MTYHHQYNHHYHHHSQEGQAHPDHLRPGQPLHHLRPEQENQQLGQKELPKPENELHWEIPKELDQYAGDALVFLL